MFPMHQYSMHSMTANYHCDYRLILMMIMSTLGFPEGHFYREGSKKAAQKMELFYFIFGLCQVVIAAYRIFVVVFFSLVEAPRSNSCSTQT